MNYGQMEKTISAEWKNQVKNVIIITNVDSVLRI